MAGERGLAKHVRTGLSNESTTPTLRVIKGSPVVHELDIESFGKTTRQHVREFACIMATILCIIAGVKLWNHSVTMTPYYCVAGALAFLFLGYVTPNLLLPIWKGWMKFAVALGMVMSTILVSIAWFMMFVPMGILFKIIGKRVMDLRYKAPVDSYWEERDTKLNDFKLLERQY